MKRLTYIWLLALAVASVGVETSFAHGYRSRHGFRNVTDTTGRGFGPRCRGEQQRQPIATRNNITTSDNRLLPIRIAAPWAFTNGDGKQAGFAGVAETIENLGSTNVDRET